MVGLSVMSGVTCFPPPFHIDVDRYSHTQPLRQKTDKEKYRHRDTMTEIARNTLSQRDTYTYPKIETLI